jgi:hypothetical protein
MDLNSILGALGADAESQPAADQAGNDPAVDSLGSLLGGGAAQGSGGAGDLLGSLLGGGAPQGAGGAGDLLGSLLGGGAAQGSGGAGDLLGSLLGGGGAQGAGGAGDLLGSLLGGGAPQGSGGAGGLAGAQAGGAGSLSGNAILGPIVDGLAQKMGLPPALAEMVVGFVLSRLLGGQAGATGATSQGNRLGMDGGQGDSELGGIIQRLDSGQGLDSRYLHSTGLPQQLAEQTGLDLHTATGSLQHVFEMLAGGMGSGRPS